MPSYNFNLANASEQLGYCHKRSRWAKRTNKHIAHQWRKEAQFWAKLRKRMMSGETTS